jgi:hypothetical protein
MPIRLDTPFLDRKIEELKPMGLPVNISLLLCALGVICSSTAAANDLEPFTTDGCSMWMDGTPEQPNLWRHCCVAHDKAYWLGGSKAERQQADDDIKVCVKTALGPKMAAYMYTNIRWGGSPYWPMAYRWGYGWDYWDGAYPRGYKEITAEEQQQIQALLPQAERLIAEDAKQHPSDINSPRASAQSKKTDANEN